MRVCVYIVWSYTGRSNRPVSYIGSFRKRISFHTELIMPVHEYTYIHTVRARREVHWEVEAGEGGDVTAHAHSAYSYSKHTVLQ
jgi:hypothetical protein